MDGGGTELIVNFLVVLPSLPAAGEQRKLYE